MKNNKVCDSTITSTWNEGDEFIETQAPEMIFSDIVVSPSIFGVEKHLTQEEYERLRGCEEIVYCLMFLKEVYGNEKDEKLNEGARELKQAINTVWKDLELHSVYTFKDTVKLMKKKRKETGHANKQF
jgi:hypothetical protein